ncbi:MAG TPA: hypothetical protein VNV41_16465 [Candidatus Acidoferrales bacterium]|jgi:hypothetical protein|nr:hypothetical protein [Candidatus Acidoferrales bacterium]
MGRLIDLTGQTFGILTVVERVGVNEHRQSMYKVLCGCGEIRIVRGSDLLTEKTRSCGTGCKRKTEWQLEAVFAGKAPVFTVSTITRGDRDTKRFGKQ